MIELSAAEFERARTFMLDIVETLLPGVKHRDEGNERRFLAQGGLTVNRKSGLFHLHSARRSGYSAIVLVMLLKQCVADEATIWVRAWLDNHPGIGSCDGDRADEDDTPPSAAQAEEFLDRLVDVIGTPGEAYLQSRRLDAPFPATQYIEYARCGEGALVGILTSHDRIVGLQVLYLIPAGEKSTVAPVRRRCMLERAGDAVFKMPYTGDNTDVWICEGLEDALSIYRYGKRRCRVLGLPGIGTLKHLKFAPGTRIFIARDGDLPGSAADKSLHDGIDRLILSGCEVFITLGRMMAGMQTKSCKSMVSIH